MTTRELLHEKREEILALAAKHKAHNVRVFGSAVRGEDGPESDVDFLVEFEPGVRLMERLTFMVELEELLGRQVDVCSDRSLEPLIQEQVRREAAAL
ncbi:nucleotidyltransferase family protein [bacterium]|nr:nucleotidyltransferase family protein [bacterium]